VRVVPDAGSGLWVLAPAVGVWSDPPPAGALVAPGGGVGRLRQLNRRFALLLPEGACGWVERTDERRVLAVEHGQRLFRLAPLELAGDRPRAALGRDRGSELAADCFALAAPRPPARRRSSKPETRWPRGSRSA
jgi:hypothetical protein